MNLLALDTATAACSVALWCDGATVARAHQAMQRGHAERLLPMICDVLARARTGFPALQALAVTVGPGSFTGLRVGLATARGLALAVGLPLLGVTTLEAVAMAASHHLGDAADPACRLLSAIETKRADVYVQLFSRGGEALSDPQALLPTAVAAALPDAPVRVAGDAARRLIEAIAGARRDLALVPGVAAPDAAFVAAAAVRAIDRGGMPDRSMRPSPLYIHPPRATLPRDGGRLRP